MDWGGMGTAVAAAIILYYNYRTSKQTNKKVESANAKVEKVNATLTTNNGGSHVKDQLDRIEYRLITGEQRFERVEKAQDRQSSKIDAVDKKLNAHINNQVNAHPKSRRGKNA